MDCSFHISSFDLSKVNSFERHLCRMKSFVDMVQIGSVKRR
jgi:hypothetical protein